MGGNPQPTPKDLRLKLWMLFKGQMTVDRSSREMPGALARRLVPRTLLTIWPIYPRRTLKNEKWYSNNEQHANRL